MNYKITSIILLIIFAVNINLKAKLPLRRNKKISLSEQIKKLQPKYEAGDLNAGAKLAEIYSTNYQFTRRMYRQIKDPEYVADGQKAFKIYKNLADNHNIYNANMLPFYISGFIKIDDKQSIIIKYAKKALCEDYKNNKMAQQQFKKLFSDIADYCGFGGNYNYGYPHFRQEINSKGKVDKLIPFLENAVKSCKYPIFPLRILAYCNLYGVGVERNFDKYLELVQKGVDFGDTKIAYGSLIIGYLKGISFPKDDDKALKYFKDFLELDNNSAITVNNYVEEFKFLAPNKLSEIIKIIKQKANNKIKPYNKVMKYLTKLNLTNHDEFQKRITNLEKHAERGNPQAMYDIRQLYNRTSLDPKKLIYWIEKTQNLYDFRRDFPTSSLVYMYLTGYGTEINPQKAFQILQKEQGNNYSIGAEILIMLYLTGFGIEKNPNEAITLLKDKLEKNDFRPLKYPLRINTWLEIIKITEENTKK